MPSSRTTSSLTAVLCSGLVWITATAWWNSPRITATSFHNDVIAFNALQSKVFRLIEEIHSDRFGHAAQVSVCVNDLLLLLNRQAHELENPKEAKEGLSLYQNLLYYIEDHLEEDLTLEKLAAAFYVSKYHIAHVFKDSTGLSVHQYIMKKRLFACKNAIPDCENISDVYLQFGFKDYSSFYRAFKKEFGISPKEYKSQCANAPLNSAN